MADLDTLILESVMVVTAEKIVCFVNQSSHSTVKSKSSIEIFLRATLIFFLFIVVSAPQWQFASQAERRIGIFHAH